MDEIFYKLSKSLIFVPLVIIIIGLFLKYNNSQNQKINFNSSISPTLSFVLSPTLVNQNNKLGLSIKDSFECFYQDKKTNDSYLLKVDKGKINLEATISGQIKKYDFSSYGFFIENILKSDINKIEEMVKPYLQDKGIDIKTLIKSCQKKH